MKKSPAIITTLIAILIISAVYFDRQNEQLRQKIELMGENEITTPVNNANLTNDNLHTDSNRQLEDLNNQLIIALNRIKFLEKKTLMTAVKPVVLDSAINQNKAAREEIKILQENIEQTQEELVATTQKLNHNQRELQTLSDKLKTETVSAADREKIQQLKSIISVFKQQNKTIIQSNIERIKDLKNASSSITITGIIVPAVGVATLIAYTIEEINNYCENISNTINLEKKIFAQVISLDAQLQKEYNNQCLQ